MSDTDKVCDKAYDKAIENLIDIHVALDECRFAQNELPDFRVDTVRLPSVRDDVVLFRISATNLGSEPVRPTAIDLKIDGDAVPGIEADAWRFYKEGLTVVGVAGSRRSGDCDFELDPNFLPLTVSDPAAYRWDRPGRFLAEQVGVVQDERTGEALLAGLVTSTVALGRIALDAGAPEGASLRIVLDVAGLQIPPGETVVLETLMLARGRDVERLLEDYADELGARMGALNAGRVPRGWCSYYQYYGHETEDDILENARFLAAHREDLPAEVIQIDDGWQAARGHWLESHAGKFPHGMAWLAAQIRELGFTPGIWVAPFLVSESAPIHRDHPEWLLRDRNGVLLAMGDNHFLDPTHPEALAWLKEVFQTLREWGYAYFKLDFLFVGTHHGARYHADGVTRVQAYRGALAAIREAVGAASFILGGTSLIGPNVGLVDGCRISTDVTPFWGLPGRTPESPAIANVCRNIVNRGYQHRRLWINDPDCLIVREAHGRAKYAHIPSLTLAETRMLASAMILSGGALFLGDRLAPIPTARLAILETVWKLANGRAARPLDRMAETVPRLWLREGEGTEADPHLLGVFNWDEASRDVPINWDALGLGPGDWACADVWNGGTPTAERGAGRVALPPRSCRLFRIAAASREAKEIR